jgi:hypothetical protein
MSVDRGRQEVTAEAFNPAISGQQIRHEHLGKLRLIMECREHGSLRDDRPRASEIKCCAMQPFRKH